MWIWDEIDQYCFEKGIFDHCTKLKKRPDFLKRIKELLDIIDGVIYIPAEGISVKDARFIKEFVADEKSEKIVIGQKTRTRGTIRKVIKRLRIDYKGDIKYILNLDVPGSRKARMLSWIRKIIYGCKGSYLYDFLCYEGLCEKNTKRLLGEISFTDADICLDQERFTNAHNTKEKEIAAKRLFGDFVFIKDFSGANYWLEILLDLLNDGDQKQLYQDSWDHIQSELRELKALISDKEHIVVNWIDNVRGSEAHRLPYVYDQLNHGISFENMYTPTPYTWGVMRSIMTDRFLIDDRIFDCYNDDSSNEGFEDCRLINLLKENGYRFICVSPHFLSDFFSNSRIKAETLISIHVPSSMIQFEAVREMSRHVEKSLVIIHNLFETHFPYYNPIYMYRTDLDSENGYDEKIRDKTLKQEEESSRYLDSQLAYYSDFYKDVRYRIYMSDHGQIRWEDEFCLEEKYHVLFGIIPRGSVKNNRIIGVHSLKEFCDIISACLNDNINEICNDNPQEGIWIQHDDIYNYSMLESIKKKNKINNMYQYLQCRGVVTDQDAYVKMAIGNEFYFRNKEKTNLIMDECYNNRIDKLRILAGNRFIDIYKEEKYRAAKELYEYLGLKDSDDIELI